MIFKHLFKHLLFIGLIAAHITTAKAAITEESHTFMDFPKYIMSSILRGFVDTPALVQLDTACCNHKYRPRLQDAEKLIPVSCEMNSKNWGNRIAGHRLRLQNIIKTIYDKYQGIHTFIAPNFSVSDLKYDKLTIYVTVQEVFENYILAPNQEKTILKTLMCPFNLLIFDTMKTENLTQLETVNLHPSASYADFFTTNNDCNPLIKLALLSSIKSLKLSNFVNDSDFLEPGSFPSLTYLDTSYCTNLTDKAYRAIAENSPYLTTLHCCKAAITNNTLCSMLQNGSLTQLMLGGCRNLTPSIWREAQNLDKLKKLYLSNASSPSTNDDLFVLINHAPNLVLLELNHFTHITYKLIEIISEKIPHLESLHLDYCKKITDEVIPYLGKLTSLKKLSLAATNTTMGKVKVLKREGLDIYWFKEEDF